MLRIDDLVVTLDGHTAVDHVSLEVGRGEVVAILGPSGSGKTTFLRAVAGLQRPDAGHVVLDGRPLDAVAPHRRGLGLMFQDYALFPHLDVEGNVAFGLRMRGDRPAARRARVGEVLDLVGLAGFGSRAVSSLSGGERQRVALARALAPAPSVLMLDEPLGALDRALRERLLLDLQRMFAELDIGVLYVTHDQGEALTLADRLVVLRDGAVARAGTPQDVWSAPGDEWVARFLGFDNVFTGSVRGGSVWLAWSPVAVHEPVSMTGEVTVLIRPWGVELTERSPADDTGVVGVVDGHRFGGETSEIRLRLATGERLMAEVPRGQAAPAHGDRVGVEIDPRAVEVLDRPSERAD
jgi:thiamine transport system ATP-binding protein